VSRCPTVAADPGRARSAQRPRLGRCPRNFGAPGSRSRPRSPAEPAGARNANHTGSNPRGVAPTVAEAAVPPRRRGAGGVGARFGEPDGRSSRLHQSLEQQPHPTTSPPAFTRADPRRSRGRRAPSPLPARRLIAARPGRGPSFPQPASWRSCSVGSAPRPRGTLTGAPYSQSANGADGSTQTSAPRVAAA
jgi:hypothetical protein